MDQSISGEGSRAAAKAQLRAQFRALRSAIPPEEARAANAAIREALYHLPEARAAATVYAFWPLTARAEVDLRPLLVDWYAEGKTIALPRVVGFAPPELTFHVWQPDDARVRSGFGVEEPIAEAPAAPPPDLILVPALSVDAQGFRLGYGGGFYDALLATMPAFTVVPLADVLLTDRLPREVHDRPVGAVVTDRRQQRFSLAAQP